MSPEQFNIILNRRIDLIKKVLSAKEKEYACHNDRLHNFNRAGMALNISREQALMGMMIKHFISILDMIEYNKKLTVELVEEKIGDTINYLILLEASFKETIENTAWVEEAENNSLLNSNKKKTSK